MKTYKKNCSNCGNVYYNSRPQSTTCSQKCRTQLYYKRKYSNQSVQTFQQSTVETLNSSIYENHIYANNPVLKRFNGSSNSKNVLTDDCLIDLSSNPGEKMCAYRVKGKTNYFIDQQIENQLAETIMYNGRVYHFLGFFEDNSKGFNRFFTEIGSNQADFIYLESVIDYYETIKCILIYIHEKLVEKAFNDIKLSIIYDFIPCFNERNDYVYYDEDAEKFFVRMWSGF